MSVVQPFTALSRVFCLVCLTLLAGLLSPIALASGLLKPVNSQYQDLKIQTHHVNVVIEDGYATTQVEQVFYNPNDTQMEARYSFPVPEQAVVGEFIYWIDGQPVIAEAVAKDDAEQIYQTQKEQGRSTALTTKNEFKTFEIKVFPVLPKQTVKIRLVYLQDALLDHGVGRYVYPMEEGGVDEIAKAFWTRNDEVEQDFSFQLTVKSAYPVDGLRLPEHPQASIASTPEGEQTVWSATLANQIATSESTSPDPAFRLDQDIVAYWRLQEGLPGRLDMIAYRDPTQSEKGTIKLTFTPGDDLGPIVQGRDWVFVLDKSGSMAGKYATLAEGVRRALGTLTGDDRFRIVLFDNRAYALTPNWLAATSDNIDRAMTSVIEAQTGGGTNLYDGLEKATQSLDRDRTTGMVLVTDGVANVGVTEKKAFLKLMQKHDIRLYTFIMGNSANRPLLEPMTQVSDGFALSVSNADDILGHIINATSKLTHQAYRDVQLDIDGRRITDLTPAQIRSLYRGEQLSVFGHYFKPGNTTITLTAKVGGIERKYRTTLNLPDSATHNPELERLWAFAKIRDLEHKMDYLETADADWEQAIETIALDYGLLTDYTSLLVVEEDVFKQLNISRSNQVRVEKEQQARTQRAHQPARPNRADQHDPMFSQPAPSHSGGRGGSLSSWMVLLLVIVGGYRRWRRVYH